MKKRIDVVTIELDEYEQLLEDQQILAYLRARGVDNWEGYCDAMNDYYGEDTDG